MHYESEDKQVNRDIKSFNINNKLIGDLADYTEVVDCKTGFEEDFQGKDLTNKIALIGMGRRSCQDVYDDAKALGAKAVIIYSNNQEQGDSVNTFVTKDNEKPLFSIGYNDGIQMVQAIKDGQNKYKFMAENSSVTNVDENDMSQYSSWGPTSDLEFKPEVTAQVVIYIP